MSFHESHRTLHTVNFIFTPELHGCAHPVLINHTHAVNLFEPVAMETAIVPVLVVFYLLHGLCSDAG